MTLSSRHKIRNSSPGGLRPSTLPLGHGGSPLYWLSHVDGEETFFVSFKPPRPGTEPRALAWRAAVLTTTLVAVTSHIQSKQLLALLSDLLCAAMVRSLYWWWRTAATEHYLKGHAQAKIIKKSVILFWLLNMTIWCKHVHRLELQKFLNFSAAHSPVRLDIETEFLISYFGQPCQK